MNQVPRISLKFGNSEAIKRERETIKLRLNITKNRIIQTRNDFLREEQFILRVPEEISGKVRECIRENTFHEKSKFTFEEERRGRFVFEGVEYRTMLVDLPCIVESQKTFDNKNFIKTADISQMLIAYSPNSSVTIPNQYLWPDGLTSPLKDVRNRRFRKRVSKQTIESVEREVERLLKEDSKAESVTYELKEEIEYDEENISDAEKDMSIGDEELDAQIEEEINQRMREMEELTNKYGGVEDDLYNENNSLESEFNKKEDLDKNNNIDEQALKIIENRNKLEEEIKTLESSIEKKQAELSSIMNPIIKKRFEDAISKLKQELLEKKEQLNVS